MKCPECGKWNRDYNVRCSTCGMVLPKSNGGEHAWKEKINDRNHGAQYYRMDEYGESDAELDSRDKLAEEMAELKIRQNRGEARMRRMQRETAERVTTASGLEIRSHKGNLEDTLQAEEQKPPLHIHHASPVEALVRPVVRETPKEWEEGPVRASYDPMWEDERQRQSFRVQHTSLGMTRRRMGFTATYAPEKKHGGKKVLRVLFTLLFIALLGLCGFLGYQYFQQLELQRQEENRATVYASILDDLAAHTILIPGTDGQEIYIRELHSTYIVQDGFATVEVADHTWYEDKKEFLGDNMLITLTPYLKSTSGQQKVLQPITYQIDIPLSPLTMKTPDSTRVDVVSSMFTMEFVVRPGSTVTINGKNVSDTVDAEDGSLSYNANVQAIGENTYTIVCRSQYCRENTMEVVLYREPQEIPLDLAADTYTSTSNQTMRVSATTLAGAQIEVLSPHTDLDITELNTTGEFSFYAVFEEIGTNVIEIEAYYPGKKTSHITYSVYYVPNPDIYTRKAWGLGDKEYAELVNNIPFRASRHQVYAIMGTIDHFVSEKPQMAVIYTSVDGKNQPVLVQNFTSTDWEVGRYYRLYADVYGSYDNMPWLYARYTYKN